MNTSKNQRFQETDQAIKNIFLGLLEEKEFRKITVGDICSRCQINRSSFYLHFMDIFDLMDQIQKDIYQDILDSFQGTAYDPDHFIRREYLSLMLGHIRKNQTFYRAYLSGHYGAMEETCRTLYESVIHPFFLTLGFEKTEAAERKMSYHFGYVWGGMMQVIRMWLDNDCTETPEQLSLTLWQNMNPPKDLFLT